MKRGVASVVALDTGERLKTYEVRFKKSFEGKQFFGGVIVGEVAISKTVRRNKFLKTLDFSADLKCQLKIFGLRSLFHLKSKILDNGVDVAI